MGFKRSVKLLCFFMFKNMKYFGGGTMPIMTPINLSLI